MFTHSNPRNSSNFHSENCNYLFKKDYWTTNSFLVDSLKRSKAVETLTKNAIKTLKNGKIWVFLSFSFSIKNSNSENCKKLFRNDYWTTHFFYLPFSTFQPTKSDVNLAKMHEVFITRKLSRFLIIFDVNLRHFQLEKCNKPFR